jgi:hypothetical protein
MRKTGQANANQQMLRAVWSDMWAMLDSSVNQSHGKSPTPDMISENSTRTNAAEARSPQAFGPMLNA